LHHHGKERVPPLSNLERVPRPLSLILS